MRPEKLGNVWVMCWLQVIDESGARPVWRTVATCIWTPAKVAAAVRQLAGKGIRNVWVLDPTGDRKMA